jgi:hypothetical protein
MTTPRTSRQHLSRTFWSALLLLWAATCPVFAADYTEIAQGDLSGNRLSPTLWNVCTGVNRLLANTSPGDQEYLRVDIPAGLALKQIMVQLFTSSDVMFIGVQQGTTFTVTPQLATAGDMFGYTHFGTSAGNVGTNILDDMGAAPGAIGFTPPLASGSYTFWLQQGTAGGTTYQLNFDVFRPGDYNGNGQVDAADYTVWRNTLGSTTDLRADGTGPSGVPDQVVNQLDYAFWKQKYSGSAGSGAILEGSREVPEPAANAMLVCCAVMSVPLRLGMRARGGSSSSSERFPI